MIKTGGTSQSFAYDTFGNLTGDAETGASVTAMTYDLAGRLTSIDAAGTANDATFTLDALGRFRTRVLATSTDTYSYVGASETVARISNSAGPTISDSIVSPAGDRLGVKQGATLNWFLPDLHGSIAASLSSDETIVANAIRYDAYGQTIGTGSAGGTSVGDKHWTYQGRLDVSPAGLATPLYDMSARFYAPASAPSPRSTRWRSIASWPSSARPGPRLAMKRGPAYWRGRPNEPWHIEHNGTVLSCAGRLVSTRRSGSLAPLM